MMIDGHFIWVLQINRVHKHRKKRYAQTHHIQNDLVAL